MLQEMRVQPVAPEEPLVQVEMAGMEQLVPQEALTAV